MDSQNNLITIYSSTNDFEVANIQNILQDANIKSYKINANTNYSFELVPITLKVNEKDAEKALEIIQKSQQ